MHRKVYSFYFFAFFCLIAACSSSNSILEISSTRQSSTSVLDSLIVENNTTSSSLTSIQTATTSVTTSIPTVKESKKDEKSSTLKNMDGEVLEESTETTLIIDDLLLEEISQVAQENNAIRVPTRENPLRVTTIGDSVAYDADPGIKALIEATEMAEVENRSFGGVGLTQNGFEVYLEESLANKPEVVTVMVGGWDLAFAENDQEKYSEIVESSFEKILEVASLVIVIGMPPTPDTEGLEENRYLINRIYENISNLKEEIIFIDTNRVLGDENGKFTRNFKTFDGEVHQIRKVRDGKDDGHLCPFGAVLIGESVFAEISRRFPIPHTTDAWWSDNWVNDQRYDDPPGGCEQTSVN